MVIEMAVNEQQRSSLNSLLSNCFNTFRGKGVFAVIGAGTPLDISVSEILLI